jgi:hypothetical protein
LSSSDHPKLWSLNKECATAVILEGLEDSAGTGSSILSKLQSVFSANTSQRIVKRGYSTPEPSDGKVSTLPTYAMLESTDCCSILHSAKNSTKDTPYPPTLMEFMPTRRNTDIRNTTTIMGGQFIVTLIIYGNAYILEVRDRGTLDL